MKNPEKIAKIAKINLVRCSIMSIIKYLLFGALFIYILYIFKNDDFANTLKEAAMNNFGETIEGDLIIDLFSSFAKAALNYDSTCGGDYARVLMYKLFIFTSEYKIYFVGYQIFGLIFNFIGIAFVITKNKVSTILCGLIKILTLSWISGFSYMFYASDLKLKSNECNKSIEKQVSKDENNNIQIKNDISLDSKKQDFIINNGNNDCNNQNNVEDKQNEEETKITTNQSGNIKIVTNIAESYKEGYDYNYRISNEDGLKKYGSIKQRTVGNIAGGIVAFGLVLIANPLSVQQFSIFLLIWDLICLGIGIKLIFSKNYADVLVKNSKRINKGDSHEKVMYLLQNFEFTTKNYENGMVAYIFEKKGTYRKDFERQIFYFKDGIVIEKDEAYHRTIVRTYYH